jgi:hypothetical protein
MKELEPSPDFVSRVMQAVVAEAAIAQRSAGASARIQLSPTGLRVLVAAGGALLGLLNLLRLWLTVFSPAICQ